MGLDVFVGVDNHEEVFTPEYESKDDRQHSLSRTFCNFICKRNAVEGEPELDQIGRLTETDIAPIYQMEEYSDEESFDDEFSEESSEDRTEKEMPDNIDTVLSTVNQLIKKLSVMDNLPALLNDNGFDSLRNAEYFSDFNSDKDDGYIDNNFGQDLRNIKRFLDYAKSKGTKTVFFNYG